MKKILMLMLIQLYIFCALPLYGTVVYADDAEWEMPVLPDITSQFVAVMDADSGELLYASNPDFVCYPASTTKLMTGLLVIENCVLTDEVTFSDAAVGSVEPGDANVSILPGEVLTVEQSLYCLILRSANEVAYGLAEHTAGTLENFVRMMNDRAAQLGATNTHFANPSGLTDVTHYTTPRDLATIARACFENKTLMRIVSYPGLYTIGPTNTSNYTRYYRPRYKMLSGGDYAYEYSCGGKTGYTSAAGNCLVSFAAKDDLRLICVILNSTEKACYQDTTALFDYFFDNYNKLPLEKLSGMYVSLTDNPYLVVPHGITTDMLTRKVIYSDSPEYHGADGGFACIDYWYGDILMGTITAYTTDAAYSGLPGTNGVSAHSYVTLTQKNTTKYIDVRYIFYGTAAVIILVPIIIVIVRHHRKNTGIKKLRF